MNRIPFADILFIVLATAAALLIIETGHADWLSRYVILVALISYFAGKFVRSFEFKKHHKQ